MATKAKKAAPKKAAAKKKAAPKKKAAAKAKVKRVPNAAFMAPKTISSSLQLIVGKGPYPRTQVVKKLWEYIKKNNMQDKKNRRMINADANLKVIFAGKAQVSMFDMAKLVNKHLS